MCVDGSLQAYFSNHSNHWVTRRLQGTVDTHAPCVSAVLTRYLRALPPSHPPTHPTSLSFSVYVYVCMYIHTLAHTWATRRPGGTVDTRHVPCCRRHVPSRRRHLILVFLLIHANYRCKRRRERIWLQRGPRGGGGRAGTGRCWGWRRRSGSNHWRLCIVYLYIDLRKMGCGTCEEALRVSSTTRR